LFPFEKFEASQELSFSKKSGNANNIAFWTKQCFSHHTDILKSDILPKSCTISVISKSLDPLRSSLPIEA